MNHSLGHVYRSVLRVSALVCHQKCHLPLQQCWMANVSQTKPLKGFCCLLQRGQYSLSPWMWDLSQWHLSLGAETVSDLCLVQSWAEVLLPSHPSPSPAILPWVQPLNNIKDHHKKLSL